MPPMWLSELPVYYNQGGNARAFYTLMSYSTRALSATYRESVQKVISGKGVEKTKGLRNLLAIGILYGLVGASVEELKDTVGGRQKEGDFFDQFKQEIMSLFLVNKYMTQGIDKRDWFGGLVADQLMLPIVDVAGDIAYSGQKVIKKLKEGKPVGMGDTPAIKYIPLGGKLLYNWSTAGKAAKYSLQDDRKEIFGDLKKLIVDKEGSWSDWRKKKNDYNQKVRKVEGMKEITQSTVEKKKKALRRKAREEKKEQRKERREKPEGSILDSIMNFIVKDASAEEEFTMDSGAFEKYKKNITLTKVNQLRADIKEQHGVDMKVHEIREQIHKGATKEKVEALRKELHKGTKVVSRETRIDHHLKRLGDDTTEARENMDKFISMVYKAESSNDTKALNPDTTAAGGFQFIKGSVLPALNRMERLGSMPGWAAELQKTYKGKVSDDEHRKMITELTYEQQEEMFLGDILNKTVKKPGYGDALLKRIFKGDVEAMKKLYFEGHHTKPDEATRKLVSEVFKGTKGGTV